MELKGLCVLCIVYHLTVLIKDTHMLGTVTKPPSSEYSAG